MKGSFWITGLLLILLAFCAWEFRLLRRSQQTVMGQLAQWQDDRAVPAGARAAKSPAAADTGMAELALELQNFMRDMRSRQSALEKRLSDLDDRINHERETILRDLKVFLDDMRREKELFTAQVDRVKDVMGSADMPQFVQMQQAMEKMDEKLTSLSDSVNAAKRQQEELYQEENEGIKVQGRMSGPGDRTTY